MTKTINTNILIERDLDGGFILSVPGVRGLHADGNTLDEALKNLEEVTALLNEYHGGQQLFQALETNNESVFGIMNYNFNLQYA